MKVSCPYCNGEAAYHKSSAIVYRGRDFGPIYLCSNYPKCDVYVGCHKGTMKPLGRLANKELREAKKAAHTIFDPLWKAKLKKGARTNAYKWLADKLSIHIRECHIGMFDVDMCKRVIEVCKGVKHARPTKKTTKAI